MPLAPRDSGPVAHRSGHGPAGRRVPPPAAAGAPKKGRGSGQDAQGATQTTGTADKPGAGRTEAAK
jgi:hypothetical protein